MNQAKIMKWNGHEIRFLKRDGQWWVLDEDLHRDFEQLPRKPVERGFLREGDPFYSAYSLGYISLVKDVLKAYGTPKGSQRSFRKKVKNEILNGDEE